MYHADIENVHVKPDVLFPILAEYGIVFFQTALFIAGGLKHWLSVRINRFAFLSVFRLFKTWNIATDNDHYVGGSLLHSFINHGCRDNAIHQCHLRPPIILLLVWQSLSTLTFYSFWNEAIFRLDPSGRLQGATESIVIRIMPDHAEGLNA